MYETAVCLCRRVGEGFQGPACLGISGTFESYLLRDRSECPSW